MDVLKHDYCSLFVKFIPDNPSGLTNGAPVLSTGGHFYLNETADNLTLQSTDMTSITNADVWLGWFVSAFNREWLRIDLLDVDPGNEVQVCVLDGFDDGVANLICIKDSVLPTTLYSYGPKLWLDYYTRKQNSPVPGAGFKAQISIAGTNDKYSTFYDNKLLQ